MKIEIFESCCSCGGSLADLVQRAAGETGVSPEIVKGDAMAAVKRGILRTPALVVDEKVVCAGRQPKYDEILAWLGGKQQ